MPLSFKFKPFTCEPCEGLGIMVLDGQGVECPTCEGIGVNGPLVGEFVQETLVTDTVIYEVIARTLKTITVRKCVHGPQIKSKNVDGNPWPVVWDEAVPTEGKGRVIRLRKDGTYRSGRGFNAMRPAHTIEFTEYLCSDEVCGFTTREEAEATSHMHETISMTRTLPVFYTDYRE